MVGDENEIAWKRLIELLGPVHDAALRTARQLGRSAAEGDDLFQEAVLRAYHRLPTLRDPGSFRTWFYRILLSVHSNRVRRSFWRRFLSLDGLSVPDIEQAVGDDGSIREEERRQAERASRALASLPAVQREAVVLHEIEGFSVEEVAGLQKVSVSAVKSRLSRGRGRLRRHYEKIGWMREADPFAVSRESVLPESGTP
jgi:RNA polymerase sigma-70 factor (ECF subfamily)